MYLCMCTCLPIKRWFNINVLWKSKFKGCDAQSWYNCSQGKWGNHTEQDSFSKGLIKGFEADRHYPLSNMHIHRKLIIPIGSHTVKQSNSTCRSQKSLKSLSFEQSKLSIVQRSIVYPAVHTLLKIMRCKNWTASKR